jgi:RNA polymerase sigma-70 factor (ECF subfamily)
MFVWKLTDLRLVRKTRSGQPEAFEGLVLRYQRKAYAVARAIGVAAADLDDVVQEAFLQAYRDLSQLRAMASFGPWLLMIVRNVARKHLRRPIPAPGIPGGDLAVAPEGESPEARELRDHVWREISELPEELREVIFLYYYEGKALKEVAAALRLTVSGAKRRLARARQSLRRALWREAGESLAQGLPSPREWEVKGRRLSLLVMASIPASMALMAGRSIAQGTRAVPAAPSAPAARASRDPQGAGTLGKSQAVKWPLTLALFFAGSLGLVATARLMRAPEIARSPAATRPERSSREAAPARELDTRPVGSAGGEKAPVNATKQESAAAPIGDGDGGEPEARGSVLVRILWGDDKSPAAGVRARIVPWGSPDLYVDDVEFTTDAAGMFFVEGIYRGQATVLADRGGSASLEIRPAEEREVTVEVPAGVTVTGTVVDRMRNPVADARVWISYPGNTVYGNEAARTGADGSFRLRSVQRQGTHICARAAGYAPSLRRHLADIEPGRDGAIEAVIILPGLGGVLAGRVVGPGGRPIRGAKVMVGAEFPTSKLLDDGGEGLSAPPFIVGTDPEGWFFADSLPEGETPVAVRVPGFIPHEEMVRLTPGAKAQVTISMEEGGTVHGRLTNKAGFPANGTAVMVGDWRRFLAVRAFSSPDGSFELRGVPPGEVEVYANRSGWGRAATTVFLERGQKVRWDAAISQDLEISGRVIDAGGSALMGWTVILEEMLGSEPRIATQRRAETDEKGELLLAECSPVRYRLSILAPKTPFPSAVEEVALAGDPLDLVLKVAEPPSAYIEGTVLDVEGDFAAGARVTVSRADHWEAVYPVENEAGRFRVGPLPAGRYAIGVEAKGNLSAAPAEREVFAQQTLDLGPIWLRR